MVWLGINGAETAWSVQKLDIGWTVWVWMLVWRGDFFFLSHLQKILKAFYSNDTRVLSQGYSGWLGVMFTIHLHLAPRLRMSGVIPLLSQMPSSCEEGQLHPFLWCQWYKQGLIPNYRISWSIRCTVIFLLEILEKK